MESGGLEAGGPPQGQGEAALLGAWGAGGGFTAWPLMGEGLASSRLSCSLTHSSWNCPLRTLILSSLPQPPSPSPLPQSQQYPPLLPISMATVQELGLVWGGGTRPDILVSGAGVGDWEKKKEADPIWDLGLQGHLRRE